MEKNLEIKDLKEAEKYLSDYKKGIGFKLNKSQLKSLMNYLKKQRKKVGMITRSPDKTYAKGGGVRKPNY